MGSTGEIWPDDWTGISNNQVILDNVLYDCLLGNEITTYSLPTIAPGDTYTDYVSWTPPNFINNIDSPNDYAPAFPCGLSTEMDPDDGVAKYELCLLARLELKEDPIVGETAGIGTTDNIINSNNIVTTNMYLVDPFEGMINGGGDGNITVTHTGHPSVILVSNNNNTSKNLDVIFDKISAGDVNLLQNLIQVDLIPGVDLWNKWASTGFKGEGIQIVGERQIKITNLETAKLLDIPFNAKEFEPFAIKVTVLSTTGKKPANNIPKEFVFKITHSSSEPINSPSSCLFKVNNLDKYGENLGINSETIKIHPNPFEDYFNITFYLRQEEIATINLYNVQGQLVLSQNVVITSANQLINVGTSTLGKGMYICEVKTSSYTVNSKIIKIK